MNSQFQVASRCELLPYLTGLPLGLSRKQAKDLLRFRAVTVKGKATVRHDTELAPGDVVTIAARKQASDAALERYGLAIVHLDDAVVVVEKPAGLLSMGSEREKEKTAYRILNTHLKALMKTPAQQVFIVHRLDRETSGLMMFARTESAQAALQRDWKGVIKRYLAVVEGLPADAQGTLKDRLVESTNHLRFIASRRAANWRSRTTALFARKETGRCSSLRSKPGAATRSAYNWPRWVIRSSAIANTAPNSAQMMEDRSRATARAARMRA